MKKYESFIEYINDQTPRGKEMLNQLYDLIHEVVPDAEESMGYGVPSYAMKPHAKLQDKIMIAGFKSHVGFYPHHLTIDAFKDKLKPYKTLEGTVQFQYTQDIPKDLVKEMILFRYNAVHNK